MLTKNVIHALLTASLFSVVQSALPVEPTAVTVRLSDGASNGMSLTMVPSTVPAGPVEFTITNESRALKHEFMILPWSADSGPIPYDQKTQQVSENRLSDLQGVEDLTPRETVTARLVLRPGRYVAFCNEPGHFRDAMRTTFNVSSRK